MWHCSGISCKPADEQISYFFLPFGLSFLLLPPLLLRRLHFLKERLLVALKLPPADLSAPLVLPIFWLCLLSRLSSLLSLPMDVMCTLFGGKLGLRFLVW